MFYRFFVLLHCRTDGAVSRGKHARAVPVPIADLEKLAFDRSGGGAFFSISFLITIH